MNKEKFPYHFIQNERGYFSEETLFYYITVNWWYPKSQSGITDLDKKKEIENKWDCNNCKLIIATNEKWLRKTEKWEHELKFTCNSCGWKWQYIWIRKISEFELQEALNKKN